MRFVSSRSATIVSCDLNRRRWTLMFDANVQNDAGPTSAPGNWGQPPRFAAHETATMEGPGVQRHWARATPLVMEPLRMHLMRKFPLTCGL